MLLRITILKYWHQIAGEPLKQTVFQHGPFVMTNREEIIQTVKDCELTRRDRCDAQANLFLDQAGQNGFEKAHTWRSKIGNR